jgi:hypothetical protein
MAKRGRPFKLAPTSEAVHKRTQMDTRRESYDTQPVVPPVPAFKPVTLRCGDTTKVVLTKEHYEAEVARGRWKEVKE